MEIQNPENQPDWRNSEWFKEWERLAQRDYHGKRCGYWYYDNFEKIYKYVKLI